MTNDSFHEVIDALDELLEDERAALLVGDLEQVSRIFDRKAHLIERLTQLERRETGTLKIINGKLMRNQALLDQAAEGIRTVSRRLAALRRVRTSLDTYDERGTRRSIEMINETSVEKRA